MSAQRAQKVKVLDLFSGTRSIAKAFEKKGHEVYTIEFDRIHPNISWYVDIMKVTPEDILQRFGRPDVIWASPPCTTYSVAAIGYHRVQGHHTLTPKTDAARMSDELIQHTIKLIQELKPKYYFIENPRGGLRKMEFMRDLPRFTVTYCKYGDKRMKPTDIWTNHSDPKFHPACKNGDPCHESAPRGSITGTQGIRGAISRAVIPEGLCDHIVEICEKGEDEWPMNQE